MFMILKYKRKDFKMIILDKTQKTVINELIKEIKDEIKFHYSDLEINETNIIKVFNYTLRHNDLKW